MQSQGDVIFLDIKGEIIYGTTGKYGGIFTLKPTFEVITLQYIYYPAYFDTRQAIDPSWKPNQFEKQTQEHIIQLQEIGNKRHLDTPGQAKSLTIYQVPSTTTEVAFVNDGTRGILPIDISDFNNLKELRPIPFGNTQNSITIDQHIFVTSRDKKIYFGEIRSPQLIQIQGSFRTRNQVENIAYYERKEYPSDVYPSSGFGNIDPNYLSQMEITHRYIVTSEGRSGVTFYDITDNQNKPAEYPISVPGHSHHILIDGSTAYIAAGEAGIIILDLVEFPPKITQQLNTPGHARDVTKYRGYIYVADGDQGMLVFNASIPSKIELISQIDTPGNAQDILTFQRHAFLADGERGVRVININSPYFPKEVDHYEPIWGKASFISMIRVGIQSLLNSGSLPSPVRISVSNILSDSLILFTFLLISLLIFAHAVIPTSGSLSRIQGIRLIVNHYFRRIKPSFILRRGRITRGRTRLHRSGPNLLLLDAGSGVELRDNKDRSRILGPGITLQRKSERIYGTADLSFQHLVIGPLDGEEPFGALGDFEDISIYQKRLERRQQTTAFTKDHHEIVARFEITYKISSGQPALSRIFGSDPSQIKTAIDLTPVQTAGPLRDRVEAVPQGDGLAGLWCVRLWRETVQKFELHNLFPINPVLGDIDDNFQPILDMRWVILHILELLSQSEVSPLTSDGNISPQPAPSQAFRELNDRGIQVVDVRLEAIYLQQTTIRYLANRWHQNWLPDEELKSKRFHQRLSQRSLIVYAEKLAKIFASQMSGQPSSPGRDESLEMILQGTMSVTPAETPEKNQIQTILNWLRRAH
jgi:hypothetical protein